MNVAPLLLHVCLLNLTCPEQEPLILCGGGGKHPPHSSISRMVYIVNVSHVSDEDYFPQNLIGILIRGGVVGTTLRASAPFRCCICLGLGTSSIIIIHRRVGTNEYEEQVMGTDG